MNDKGDDYFEGVGQAYERGAAGREKEAGLGERCIETGGLSHGI
jgi:hypothetical protein